MAADSGDAVEIMVMKHACGESIQSEADFEAVEAKGEGNPVEDGEQPPALQSLPDLHKGLSRVGAIRVPGSARRADG